MHEENIWIEKAFSQTEKNRMSLFLSQWAAGKKKKIEQYKNRETKTKETIETESAVVRKRTNQSREERVHTNQYGKLQPRSHYRGWLTEELN